MEKEHRDALTQHWGKENNRTSHSFYAWRAGLDEDELAWIVRLDVMRSFFDAETNDPRSQAWRGDLKPWEAETVGDWDREYLSAISVIMGDLAAFSRNSRTEDANANDICGLPPFYLPPAVRAALLESE